VAALLVVGLGIAAMPACNNTKDAPPSAACFFKARAFVLDDSAPIFRELAWKDEQLVIRNNDPDGWTNVDVAIYGWLVTTSGKSRTGRYAQHVPEVPANRFRLIALDKFGLFTDLNARDVVM